MKSRAIPGGGGGARGIGVLMRIIRVYQQFAVLFTRLVNFYLVRFWSPRRSGVTLTTTHKAGFFDPGGWHYRFRFKNWAEVTSR